MTEKYTSVISFTCPLCGLEERPTEIIVSDLPPAIKRNYGEKCEPCDSAMTQEERVEYYERQGSILLTELMEDMGGGALVAAEKKLADLKAKE